MRNIKYVFPSKLLGNMKCIHSDRYMYVKHYKG